jgi:hypothetical protein
MVGVDHFVATGGESCGGRPRVRRGKKAHAAITKAMAVMYNHRQKCADWAVATIAWHFPGGELDSTGQYEV